MAKASKSQTSTDQKAEIESDAPDEVIEAEVVEDQTQSDDIGAESPQEEQGSEDETAENLDENIEDDQAAEEEESTEAPTVQPDVDPGPEIDTQPETGTRSSGFLPFFAGGVVAAAVGFGLSQYLGPFSNEVDPAVVSLQSAVRQQADMIDTLQASQQDVLAAQADLDESSAVLTGSVDGMTASLAGLNNRIDDLAGALSGIDARITELEKRPITQSLPSSAIEAYERELEDLKASVAAQRAEASAMEENAKQTAQEALARAALTRVLSALDGGQPYRAALVDLATATGQSAPAALEAYADTGAPSLASLQNSFPEAARRALGAARAETESGGNRFVSFFQTQLGARSVTAKEGTDPDAILSRSEAALRSGNLTDALAEIETLPDVAKSELSDWLAEATARQSALAAGDALTQSLNSN